MREIISGIYCIENKDDNKKYIGRSLDIENRFIVHKRLLKNNKHINKYLQNAYNKYGLESFNFYLIQECPKELLNDLECEIIEEFNTTDKNFGYNLTDGGNGMVGYKYTDDVKEKMSIERKGEGNHFFGKNHSEESKKRISESRKGIIPIPKNVTREEWSNSVSKGQRHVKRNKKGRHVGIYFYKNNEYKKPWHARISVEKGIKINIGFYSTEQEAIDAWENFYFKHYGEKYNENN